ncbi:MAG: intradiol ring-cleavage dioxygenase [Chloroflexi bacterium]|nr:intradiol ring-cleavage dioxygenase [Chloroflexota bacterium]
MDNDDRQVGRILSRREILALFGAAGAAVLAGCVPQQAGSTPPASATTEVVVSSPTVAATPAPSAETQTSVPQATADSSATVPASASTPTTSAATTGMLPTCIVSPEQTEGPYFVDDQLNRADIRSDPSDGSVKEGAPLQLTLRVSQANSNGCQPLAGAIVDIWHCDALGVYSDVTDPGFNTVGKKFLRGYQVTDANGTVQFTTIYPGWYQGRTVHIHFKIRADSAAGQSYEFTSQLYFDDSITDQVHAQAPYASKGQRTIRNAGDGIFRNGGNQLLLSPTVAGQGYAATFDVGLQMA